MDLLPRKMLGSGIGVGLTGLGIVASTFDSEGGSMGLGKLGIGIGPVLPLKVSIEVLALEREEGSLFRPVWMGASPRLFFWAILDRKVRLHRYLQGLPGLPGPTIFGSTYNHRLGRRF